MRQPVQASKRAPTQLRSPLSARLTAALTAGLAVALPLLLGGCAPSKARIEGAPAADLPLPPGIQVAFNQRANQRYRSPISGRWRQGDDLEALILTAIQGAEREILVAVQELSLPQVAEALVAAQRRGLRVAVVLENTYSTPWSSLNIHDQAALDPHQRQRVAQLAALRQGDAVAILLQGELRRLLELLGTGRLDVLLGSRQQDRQGSGTVEILVDTVGQLSKRRCGGLIVLDLGSDLRPEDFLNPGVQIDALLSVDLLLNLFSSETPLHDGAVLVQSNRIAAAGVILPLSRQSLTRHGTRHLAALGLTERFERCLCVVVSEESGTISLASQGKFERPITNQRLRELLNESLQLQAGERRRRQPRTLPKATPSGESAEPSQRIRP